MDAPTIEERYDRATRSSHLEVRETRCDVDHLIAAGWIRDGIGPMLYRLHAEWDAVRAENALAQRHQVADAAAVKAKRAEAAKAAPERVAELLAEADAIEGGARRAALTEHALQLMRLRTLPRVKDALGRWAVVQATKRRFMQPDTVVCALAGRVLQAHLDPLCRSCDGRGFSGGYGTPQLTCRACKGTGKSRAAVGKDDAERAFAAWMLADMERMLAEVERAMRHFLRQHA